MKRWISAVLSLACLALLGRPTVGRADVILQYFESRWETIERRMPDVFAAGYTALWVPPPGRADTGPTSVGYDVFNRFDLGTAAQPTQYGTDAQFRGLIAETHRAGAAVFVDLILNHNGFRDHTTPGFAASGGYPGFAVTLANDTYGDFHAPGETDRLTMRLAGLIDLAQEKNHVFVRQPAEAGAMNLPNAPVNALNRAFYPDQQLPPNGLGIRPFNTVDPMQGDPVAENATGVLLRYTQWLLDVYGVDGYRIDAAKHIPEWFFNDFYDSIVYQRGRPLYDGTRPTPYSFCEVFDGSYGLISGYIRKDGFGNRDALDFPLYFALRDMLNANGFGSWASVLTTTIDASDGNAFDGSRGVTFVSSHDKDPPANDNLAYAYILTRPGYPLVYFNALEFGSRPFPRAGRGDALGGVFGDQLRTLVDIHTEYVRDFHLNRWTDPDVLIYERDKLVLVGLNDNGDTSTTRYDERVVQTNFPAGQRLHELTGNAADATVDPADAIADVLTVDGDQRVTIRVPRNINGKGYVIYGPPRPAGTLSLAPTASQIEPDPPTESLARRRLTRIPVVTSDTFTIRLQTSDPDPLDVGGEDDNAVFRIDDGGDFNGNGVVDLQGGVTFGYEQFVTTRAPLFGGGSGLYEQIINADDLDEGMHYLQVRAFRQRTTGGPIFESFRQPFYLDRAPPLVRLDTPTNTGDPDVTQRFARVRVTRLDRTATRLYVLVDRAIDTPDAELLAACSAGNAMSRPDRDSFEFLWNFIDSGFHTLFVVAFEESGRAGIFRVAGIDVRNGFGGGPGDVNNDGRVDNFDIDPFVAALTSGAFNFRADVNGDGRLDNFDIDAFVAVLLGGP